MTKMRMTLKMRKTTFLREAISTIGTPKGLARLRAHLENEPFPHFEPHPVVEGALIRIEADGTKTAGHFVGREFVPID